jgi:hypothetical protein
MECQRCLTGKEAKYRVYTDVIDTQVCQVCADEARKLGITVEVFDRSKAKNNDTAVETDSQTCPHPHPMRSRL